jgi:hypothetical protein
MHTRVWLENLKGRDHLEDPGMEGIKMDFGETGWEGVDWLHLTQDRAQQWALMNMVINLYVP